MFCEISILLLQQSTLNCFQQILLRSSELLWELCFMDSENCGDAIWRAESRFNAKWDKQPPAQRLVRAWGCCRIPSGPCRVRTPDPVSRSQLLEGWVSPQGYEFTGKTCSNSLGILSQRKSGFLFSCSSHHPLPCGLWHRICHHPEPLPRERCSRPRSWRDSSKEWFVASFDGRVGS